MVVDDLVLLLHDRRTGRRLVGRIEFDRVVAAAALLDLLLAGRARIEGSGRFPRLEVVDRAPLHPVLDEALARVHDLVAFVPAIEWLVHALQMPGVTTEHLVERGELRVERSPWLGVATARRRPTTTGRSEVLGDRLRDVCADDAHPTPRDLALISLLHAGGAVTRVIGRDRGLCRRAERIAADEPIATAARRAIDAARAQRERRAHHYAGLAALSVCSVVVATIGWGVTLMAGLCLPVTGTSYGPAETTCLVDLYGLACCCLATLAVPVVYAIRGRWTRPAAAARDVLLWSLLGYLLPPVWIVLRWWSRS